MKLAQRSSPFRTDTVRPSSKVTVSLAPKPQAAAPPLQDAPVSISCRAGRSSAAAYRVCPSVHYSRASVIFPRKSSGVTKV